MKISKVIIGLSGGVDSAVSAYLLQAQGYQVEGLFMKNWEADDTDQHCSVAQDLADAQQVCDQLQIPLRVVNFSQHYWDRVFTYFLEEYARGRTPNPDILCNKEIKFKAFLEEALRLGADYIATGHYARIYPTDPISPLWVANDQAKDQTYFLHAVAREALQKTLCPLGDYLKADVRKLAEQHHFKNAHKKDSTGICFIGERRFKPFLQSYLLAKPGPICTLDGACIGEHDGLMFYTLGQRQGLNIGGRQHAEQAPWYVVDKLIPTNTLIVAQGAQHPRLYGKKLRCEAMHFLGLTPPMGLFRCDAKIRYRQLAQPCQVTQADELGQYWVEFETPQRAITPGQFVVFYQEACCLGGAVIIDGSYT